MNFKKYQRETEHLMNVMKLDYSSITVQRFDDMKSLLADKIGFEQFQEARYDKFQRVLGFDIARQGSFIFLIKKTPKETVYIEVELKKQ